MDQIKSFIREDDGQDVVEYGLLVATIAIVVLVATTAFGTEINAWFGALSAKITATG